MMAMMIHALPPSREDSAISPKHTLVKVCRYPISELTRGFTQLGLHWSPVLIKSPWHVKLASRMSSVILLLMCKDVRFEKLPLIDG